MKILTGKEFAAAVFSPLAAGPGMFIAMGINQPGLLFQQELLVTILQPFYFILLALPISAVAMAIIGVPVYLALKAVKLNQPWIVALIGGPIGYGLFEVLGGGEENLRLMFAVSGLSVSVCAALILRLQKQSNKYSQQDKPTLRSGLPLL